MASSRVSPPTVRCGGCGASRPASTASTAPRKPCAVCGSTAIAVGLEIVEELDVADHVTVSLHPKPELEEWRRRWDGVCGDLSRLAAPRNEPASAGTIEAARSELLSFFIRAYHLKDALSEEATSLGLTKPQIEAAITGDPALALLADVANLAKHGKLRKIRSEEAPAFGEPRGVSGPDSTGWRLEMAIAHQEHSKDAVTFANEAVEAWQRHLEVWNLV